LPHANYVGSHATKTMEPWSPVVAVRGGPKSSGRWDGRQPARSPTPEGTPRERERGHARPMHGHSPLPDPLGLRDFRARGFPRLPSLPSSELNGKEGVVGSSPTEGFMNGLQNGHFLVFLLPTQTREGRLREH
jgi:hypothetical protein